MKNKAYINDSDSRFHRQKVDIVKNKGGYFIVRMRDGLTTAVSSMQILRIVQ